MKNTLILTLVLSMASLASATMILDGPGFVNAYEPFQLVVSGLGSDVPYEPAGSIIGGVYGDTSAIAGTALPAAGNLGTVNDFTLEYNGWDFVVGDLTAGNVLDGDWIVFDYAGLAPGVYHYGLYDYTESFYTPIQTEVVVVPEPATMALLGLGGLLIRKHKLTSAIMRKQIATRLSRP